MRRKSKRASPKRGHKARFRSCNEDDGDGKSKELEREFGAVGAVVAGPETEKSSISDDSKRYSRLDLVGFITWIWLTLFTCENQFAFLSRFFLFWAIPIIERSDDSGAALSVYAVLAIGTCENTWKVGLEKA